MKVLSLLFCSVLFLLSINVSAIELSPKYQFDNLPEVRGIRNYSLDSWYAIDSQSLIVQTSPRRSYLIVLSRRLPGLKFDETLAMSSTGGSVLSRFDQVTTVGAGGGHFPVQIAKIYQLDGRVQREQVGAQITGQALRSEVPISEVSREQTTSGQYKF